jgi:hypothetical protein
MTFGRIRTLTQAFTLLTALAVASTSAAAQDDRIRPAYGSTLTFGTGLVSIPVAWLSKANGDLFATISSRRIGFGATPDTPPGADVVAWDLTQSFDLHLANRLSVGASLYGTKNQQIGFSGSVLALKQPENGGPVWLPSVAFGFRNLGSSKYQDRFVTGERRATDALGGATEQRGVYNGAPTLYGVATREFWLGKSSASVSLGYGNGLFKEDGGLDSTYSTSGTLASGVFAGARIAFPVNDRSTVSLMLENNGFDWNIGANVALGFISAGLYLSEVEESGDPPRSTGSQAERGRLANFPKFGMSLSYNTALSGILAGSRQRAEAADAQLELRRLTQEIAQRRATTRQLAAALERAKAAADQAAADQQAAIIRQLQAEQAALKAAAERLEALQKKPPEGGR